MSGRGAEIALELIGTCDSDPDEMDDLTPDELLEFDATAFRCVTCGWWCEVGEAHDNGSGEDECGDCHEGDDE